MNINRTIVSVALPLFWAFFLLKGEAKDYKGAEYRTKASFTYGRFEVRYKSTEREGVLASFFTYHDYSSGGTENWNEIDIEILGRYNDDVQFNPITPGQINHERHEKVNFNPHMDFHIYAFEWTPQYVAWFVDGIEVHRQTGTHIEQLNMPQKIMMNIWNQSYPNWSGTFNAATLPAFAFYDWVKYYSYTPGTGTYGTGNNFTFQWVDEFNSWDQTKWDKASHTFGGNLCDFTPSNAVFQNGNLILCLTDNTNLGFQDKTKPVALWARHDLSMITLRFGEEVDLQSSQTTGNYLVSGVTINGAELQPDQKTVVLSVTGLTQGQLYNIIIQNIKDKAVPANTLSPKALTIINPALFTSPVKINVGGSQALGYLADQEFASTNEYGYLDGTSTSYPSGLQISGTEEDEIFRAERYGMARYFIRVPNGTYKVKLLFAENYHSSSGKRIFDVFLQDQKVINDLDIYSLVGKNAALIKEFQNVSVIDQKIQIGFAAETDKPLINGIVIERISTDINDNYHINPDFELLQNYPNPFNPETEIAYRIGIGESGRVRLNVYDALGREVTTLVNDYKEPGDYLVQFDAAQIPSGIYFYELTAGNFRDVKKMVLMR